MYTTTYDLLVAHPFLDGMSDVYLRRLAMWGHAAVFHAGSRVFQEGATADRFWLIRQGGVALDTEGPDGRSVVEELGPGTVLGWSWLLPPYRWHFGAVAVEDTFTVVLDAAGVRRLSEEDPALGYELTRRFLALIVDRLQHARRRLVVAPDDVATGPHTAALDG